MPRQWNPTTISLHKDMLTKLDELRNDVPRSRYIARLVEQHIKAMKTAGELSD